VLRSDSMLGASAEGNGKLMGSSSFASGDNRGLRVDARSVL
jgi:hypothetical protein